jgi:hypothetical protein
LEEQPAFVLYVSTGVPDEGTPGKVYQVTEHGRVMGWVDLPSAPTGLALHRDKGLVVAMPRDGGRVMKIDDTGKPSTLIEKSKELVHPVDVGIAGESDTIVVADNIADVLMATSTGGIAPKVYERFEGQKWTAQDMSVAVTKDKHVMLGTDGNQGIFRFAGDEHSANSKPLLPGPGGVAADPNTLKWAATQKPNQIYVFEGEVLQRKLRLPPGKSFYRNGLVTFAPGGGICVVVRDSDKTDGQPWLLMYDDDSDDVRSLFPWDKETMTDFVAGPRMLWERNEPTIHKTTY